jgi:hypothetical protein
MTRRIVNTIGVLLLGGTALGAQAVAPIQDSYYAAGESVELPAPVEGDVVVAGRRVTIAHRVSGDVLAAGWRIHLTAPADDDVRAAGAELLLNAPVRGDLTAAGGELTVGTDARVVGRTWLSGATVRAQGIFERELRIAGDHVELAGDIRGPVRVVAQRLDILPSARIEGPLTYEGATAATVAAGARLAHPITYRNIPAREARAARWPRAASSVLFGVHVFVGGLLLLLLVPRLARGPAKALRAEPVQSLLAGLMLFVTVPFLALLLMISLIGLPTGLALGAVYFSVLFLGVVITALVLGELEAQWLRGARPVTTVQRAAFLLAGVVTLAVLRSIPVLGTAVVFAAIVFGLGSVGLWTYRAYLRPMAAAT